MPAQDAVFEGPEISWFSLSPMLVLVEAALFLLLAGALVPRWPRGYAFVTACAAGAAAVLSMVLWDATDEGPSTLVGNALAFDTFAMFVTVDLLEVAAPRLGLQRLPATGRPRRARASPR